jgi:hypothetical protein
MAARVLAVVSVPAESRMQISPTSLGAVSDSGRLAVLRRPWKMVGAISPSAFSVVAVSTSSIVADSSFFSLTQNFWWVNCTG